MEYLYAPWRTTYITQKKEKVEGCVFCHIADHSAWDERHHVLYRDDLCFVVMNRYPYTPGHFMVIPHQHIDTLEALDQEVWLHMNKRVYEGVTLLKSEMGAHGVNLGMNIGAAAGAGIAEHLHYHLVPRFMRDTNFMTSVAQTRVYGTDFEKIYRRLKGCAERYFS